MAQNIRLVPEEVLDNKNVSYFKDIICLNKISIVNVSAWEYITCFFSDVK